MAIESNLELIKKTAKDELIYELFREAVEKEKQRLREYRPWWERLFPWKIIVVRRKDAFRLKESSR